MPAEITQEDRGMSELLYQQMMSDKITDKEIYDMFKAGQLTPGTSRLIGDYIDLGYHAAEEFLEERKAALKADGTR